MRTGKLSIWTVIAVLVGGMWVAGCDYDDHHHRDEARHARWEEHHDRDWDHHDRDHYDRY